MNEREGVQYSMAAVPLYLNGVEDFSDNVQTKDFNQRLLLTGACFNH